MRRQYTKPDLVFEDFTLMEAISRSCASELDGFHPYQGDELSCYVVDDYLGNLFTADVSGCTNKVVSPEHLGTGYFGSN